MRVLILAYRSVLALRFDPLDLSVVVILMTAMLMFLLGIQVERQRRPVPEIPSKKMVTAVQETRATLEISVQA